MKNGIELIAQERDEQLNKHGFTPEFEDANKQYYNEGQHTQAALYSLSGNEEWPESWNTEWREKIDKKPYKERLVIAAALLAAEYDYLTRLGL